ncbi:hypothetical protein ACWDRB_67695, partial [Nonomuraea sp. NPDC003707]
SKKGLDVVRHKTINEALPHWWLPPKNFGLTRIGVRPEYGGVALQLALRHPTLVNKLVTLSAAYRRAGWYPRAAGTPARDIATSASPRHRRYGETMLLDRPSVPHCQPSATPPAETVVRIELLRRTGKYSACRIALEASNWASRFDDRLCRTATKPSRDIARYQSTFPPDPHAYQDGVRQ